MKYLIAIALLILFSPLVSATLTVYPASCTAGQECNVYYKFETALADYKCVIDVFGGTSDIRVYSSPSSAKLDDEKSMSKESAASIASAATKSIDAMMFATLPRMVGGQYVLNIECGDGKTTETALSSVKVESPKMEISGTQYEAGSSMKIFTQIADGVSYDNGTCFLTVYYPNNVKLLNNVVMTTLGENGMYYWNSTAAPNTLGIYMTSVKCSFPEYIAETDILQYNASDGIDTYVSSGAANTNYRTDTDIRVEKSAPRWEAYIKPTLTHTLGQNHTVPGATLYLFRMSGASITPVDIFPITSAWSESTVTWNTKPTVSRFSCTNNNPTSVQAVDGWYSWDMTRCIRNFSYGQNTTPYYGFAINATTTVGEKRFYSSDYVGWQLGPRLIVTHSNLQNISYYVQGIAEIQVVPATFNGSIDLTELGNLVNETNHLANQTNYETHQICLESGVCIDDPKFLDYRRGIGMVGIGVGGNAFSDTNLLFGILFMTLLIFITLLWVYKKRTHKKVVTGYVLQR